MIAKITTFLSYDCFSTTQGCFLKRTADIFIMSSMWKIHPHKFIRNHRPLVMGHRGDSFSIPENTIQAFEDAYKMKVDCIETDVHMTKDNKFVHFHDPNLERTTNGVGKIADYTLAELKELDAGFKFQPEGSREYPYRGKGLQILSIDEVLPCFPKVRFNLDIKSSNPEAPKLLAEKLKELNVEERVCVGSFHQQQIIRFREYTEAITSAGKKEVIKFLLKFFKWRQKLPKLIEEEHILVSHEVISRQQDGEMHQELENTDRYAWGVRTANHQKLIFGHELPYFSLQVPMKQSIIKIISPQFIEFAHFLGIAVHVWTINDPDVMKQLLLWGVDGIFTDKPRVLLEIMK